MVVPPLVLLLMMPIARNFMLGLGTHGHVLVAAPVDGRSLTRSQLPVGIDEKALQGGEQVRGFMEERYCGMCCNTSHVTPERGPHW